MKRSISLLCDIIHQINRSLGPRVTALAMMVGAALTGPSAAQVVSARSTPLDSAAEAPEIELLPMPGAGIPSPAMPSTGRTVLDRAMRNTLSVHGRKFNVDIGIQVVPGETGRRLAALPPVHDTFGEPLEEADVQAALTSDAARAYLGRGRPSAAPAPTEEMLQRLNHSLGRAAGARMVAQDRMHFLLEVEEALESDPSNPRLMDLFELSARSFNDALELARMEYASLRQQVVAQRVAGRGVEAHVDALNELSARVDPKNVLPLGGLSLTVYGLTMRQRADEADAMLGLNRALFRGSDAGMDLHRFSGRVNALDLSVIAADQQAPQQAKSSTSESTTRAHR